MKTPILLASVILSLSVAQSARAEQTWKFDFDGGGVRFGYTSVGRDATYSEEKGYGWLADRPSVFSVKVPEGNYDVTVHFKDRDAAAAATVKAEARRLMLKKSDAVKDASRSFTVNVRTPAIAGGRGVGLNKRELGPPMVPHWDDRLTLEFLGQPDGVAAVDIAPAPGAVTVYLAGDSTVTDQPNEPWAGWGQMLPGFFEQGVAVANHAESGRALFSFRGERRLEKILSTMKAGDYLFIQFGHNDQKDKSEGAGPFTSYKENLKQFIAAAREKEGIPVLVTPMERRRWSGGKAQETLTDFAEAVRQAGSEENVPVIDLHAMSLKLYEALGADGSKQAFVHYPANTFPGQDAALKDDTHHNVYGAYELARAVVNGIREKVPDLAKHLRGETGEFDPASPDAPESLDIAPSPAAASAKPEGN